MLNPNVKLPPCSTKEVSIKKEHFKASKATDALLSPLALAIKPLIKQECDVLATSKQVLFYSCPFNRNDIDIVLGQGREAIINIPEDIIYIIKAYEEDKIIEEVSFKFPIPISILDS